MRSLPPSPLPPCSQQGGFSIDQNHGHCSHQLHKINAFCTNAMIPNVTPKTLFRQKCSLDFVYPNNIYFKKKYKTAMSKFVTY